MNASPLKVLQFIEGSGGVYGAAVSVLSTAKALRARDVQVEFAVFRSMPFGQILRAEGFAVHEVSARHRIDFRGISQLVRMLRTGEWHVLHTHLSRATVNGTIAARMARVPVVSTIHGMNRKYSYTLANHIITVSEAAKLHLVSQGVPASKVTAVYNGIDIGEFDHLPAKAGARAHFGLNPESFVISTVSRAVKSKGIGEALDAVAELLQRGINAQYLLVGDGPDLADFRRQADQLGIGGHCVFAGYQQDVRAGLAAADVFLFPTHREAFGISLVEAMAARLPIISTAVDGVREVLSEETAVFSDRKPACLASALEELARDEPRRSALANAARDRVEAKFTTERSADGVQRVYQGVLESFPARAAVRELP